MKPFFKENISELEANCNDGDVLFFSANKILTKHLKEVYRAALNGYYSSPVMYFLGRNPLNDSSKVYLTPLYDNKVNKNSLNMDDYIKEDLIGSDALNNISDNYEPENYFFLNITLEPRDVNISSEGFLDKRLVLHSLGETYFTEQYHEVIQEDVPMYFKPANAFYLNSKNHKEFYNPKEFYGPLLLPYGSKSVLDNTFIGVETSTNKIN